MKLATKYASRSTINKMSRADVEERIERASIELPVLTDELPPWWDDRWDWLLDEGTTVEAWNVAHLERRAQWTREQKRDREHPQARQELYLHGLRAAVKRSDVRVLNQIIVKYWREIPEPLITVWALRTMTKTARELAVVDIISKENSEEK